MNEDQLEQKIPVRTNHVTQWEMDRAGKHESGTARI